MPHLGVAQWVAWELLDEVQCISLGTPTLLYWCRDQRDLAAQEMTRVAVPAQSEKRIGCMSGHAQEGDKSW